MAFFQSFRCTELLPIRFLNDSRSGRARGLLSLAVAKAKNRDAVPVLLAMLGDEDFAGFAAEDLGILRVAEAVPKLRVLAEGHSKAWVRREASKALKRIKGRLGTLKGLEKNRNQYGFRL
jgi:hypothetical protein